MCQTLGTLKRMQQRLERCTQERNQLSKQLWRAERDKALLYQQMKQETAQTAFFADRLEYLETLVLRSGKPLDLEAITAQYTSFKARAEANLKQTKSDLGKLECSIGGKHETQFVDEAKMSV